MPFFPDKRGRYAGAHPWDFEAGTAREGNPSAAPEAKTILAKRGEAPNKAFRVTTASQELRDLQNSQPQDDSEAVNSAGQGSARQGAGKGLPAGNVATPSASSALAEGD